MKRPPEYTDPDWIPPMDKKGLPETGDGMWKCIGCYLLSCAVTIAIAAALITITALFYLAK